MLKQVQHDEDRAGRIVAPAPCFIDFAFGQNSFVTLAVRRSGSTSPV